MRIRLPVMLLLLGCVPCGVGASKQSPIKTLDPREATMWFPHIEWTLENPSFSGNPFDVMARVRFAHEPSGATHTTEMFFTGEDTWRFRFTGDREGVWLFTTSSADPELDGYSGRILVRANPNPDVTGFLTHVGNRFALQHRDADDLRAHLFNVYMNGHIISREFKRFAEPKILDALLDDTQANGFDTAFIYLCHNWLNLGTLRHDEHRSVNPDLATFDILDTIIVQAQARAMRWHFWAWGDEARKWTPHGLPGGINGEVDRRLQRYIAARLGPLPGWTMGYGFDLIEWTNEQGRNGWAEYLHEKMGWDHLLCTRGYALHNTHNNITAYSGFGGRDLSTTRGGPADYHEVVSHLEADPLRPSFYEERHSYLREGFNLDMDGTRRLRWWQAMAGGLGGFYGFYSSSPHPYPSPEQLRTVERFWKGRFTLDLKRANDLTDGYALSTPDRERLIFYKEAANAIEADLSDIPHPARAVAVDTCKRYEEIDLGMLDAREHTVSLPYQSDWAIAIGQFGQQGVSTTLCAKTKVIFDTDMGSDCDDAGAMAVLHTLANRGEVDLLGVIFSSAKNRFGVGVCDAINTYYGRGELPLGQNVHDDVGDPRDFYSKKIATNKALYHHNVVDSSMDMVSAYRLMLEKEPDDSVTIITIGHPIGLVHLIRDDEGARLVKKKVSRWVAMGGGGWNLCKNGMAQYMPELLQNWPCKLYLSSHGATVITGHIRLPQTPNNNPVRKAYEAFIENCLEKGRPSWDQIAVLFAVRPQLFKIESRGSVEQLKDESVHWNGKIDNPNHYRVLPAISDSALQDVIEGLMSEPPAHSIGAGLHMLEKAAHN